MTTTTRQNNLILNEDWKRIYQTFKNADFKSYDFENLRRVIIAYIRENYPEDFNDYIASSEYMALINAVAWLGQSLSFRIELASRENFLELAERKESVLKIARMLSYQPSRNISASGLLKFTSVSTSEEILDSNGKNLAQQLIMWNDPTNANWLEQFITVLNSAMSPNTEFGKSQGSATIGGIPTQQYRFNTSSTDVPIYSYTKPVSSRSMVFELVSTAFKNSESIYEEPPVPGNQLGFVYRNDGSGPGGASTGFFLMFKQGSLELADFSIDVPTTNEKVSVDTQNINNEDVWLYTLGSQGDQTAQWAQVSNLVGNNIAYNSVSKNIRNIFSIITKENDQIELAFSDGVYGNLPQGKFRLFYRVSNGLTYNISPTEMRGINISIPYTNKSGVAHVLNVSLALQESVSNASSTESIDSIRTNAPATYYTQNRMITGEDYNLAPLASSQDILKIKAVNRTSSGISRNYEIIDVSGKYSSINVFADDGFIYKEPIERELSFKFTSTTGIINTIRNTIEPVIASIDVYNFYFTNYDKKTFVDLATVWNQQTTDVNLTTGYFTKTSTILQVGAAYVSNNLAYLAYGAMVKFVPPAGHAFKDGKLVTLNAIDPLQVDRLWTKVIKVVTDGTANNTGILSSGLGPISFNDTIPTGSIISAIVPKFVIDLPVVLESEMVNLISQNLSFGLRYDSLDTSWHVISADNLDLVNNFSLVNTGNVTSSNLDSSWMIAFIKDSDRYNVKIRALDYVFGSVSQNRFYFDAHEKSYNDQTGSVIKDTIKILGINTQGADLITPLNSDIPFEIHDTIQYADGYESASEVKIAFSDVDSDGVIDNPEAFEIVVGSDLLHNYIFFKETSDSYGNISYSYVDPAVTSIVVLKSESEVIIDNYVDGQLIFFYSDTENYVKTVNKSTNTLSINSAYKGNIGRSNLKFQYLHNANSSRRIDPSSSNIIDISIVTRSYDEAFRTYLAGGTTTAPEPPTSESLRITFGTKLNAIKSISDEIIYHPVKYKILFGTAASEKLQAQFKVVKNPNKTINDNDLKVRIISAINTFFDVNYWDFGDKFYLGELTTYILNTVSPDISNIVIVPKQTTQSFGSLFEIQSKHDELLISGATVDNIDIVSAITALEVRAASSTIVSST